MLGIPDTVAKRGFWSLNYVQNLNGIKIIIFMFLIFSIGDFDLSCLEPRAQLRGNVAG